MEIIEQVSSWLVLRVSHQIKSENVYVVQCLNCNARRLMRASTLNRWRRKPQLAGCATCKRNATHRNDEMFRLLVYTEARKMIHRLLGKLPKAPTEENGDASPIAQLHEQRIDAIGMAGTTRERELPDTTTGVSR